MGIDIQLLSSMKGSSFLFCSWNLSLTVGECVVAIVAI